MNLLIKLRILVNNYLQKFTKEAYSKLVGIPINNENIFEFYTEEGKLLFAIGRLKDGEFFLSIHDMPRYAPLHVFNAIKVPDISKDMCKRMGLTLEKFISFAASASLFKKNHDCVILWTSKEGVKLLGFHIPSIFKENPYPYLELVTETMKFNKDEILTYDEIKSINKEVNKFREF